MYGSLLTDLSKAFDCLPHRLLIAKLNAYGVSNEACTLVAKYFQERYQRVKIGNTKSEWMEITKGCPQGSLMGPLAYNIYSNDLLLTIQNICDVYNYADDNSVGCSGNNPEEITNNLKHVVNITLKWFEDNYLKANPDKFQFILFSKLRHDCTLSINEKVNISSSTEVKLLGVTIDASLSFSSHINNLCIKAGKHISVLDRLSNVLNKEAKYQLFNTFVLSHFNFCSVVWHFCTMSDLRKIEKVQKRALRIIFNDKNATYTELRKQSGRPLMYVERIKHIVQTIFKMYHGISPNYLNGFISKANISYDIRNRNILTLPNFKSVKYGYDSLKLYGVLLWNNMPNEIRSECDFNIFKRLLAQWKGPSCQCSYCKLCTLNHI